MSVKIRLARRGRKKQAIYDVIIADSRAPRDGRFIEKIGSYNPNTNPASIVLDNEKAFDWVMKGAQPTDTVRAVLSYRGIMYRKHLQIGVNKGAISQEDADKKLEVWLAEKESKIQGKVDNLAKAKADKKKAALDAERKVNEARAEEQKKRLQEAEAALVEEIKEGSAEGDEDVAEEVAEVEATDQAEATETVVEEKKEEPATEAVDDTTKEESKKEVVEEAMEKKEDSPAEEPKATSESKDEEKGKEEAKSEKESGKKSS
ncbi:MAG: 30S ribosomal protein S16 [Bacteroidota bacterium]